MEHEESEVTVGFGEQCSVTKNTLKWWYYLVLGGEDQYESCCFISYIIMKPPEYLAGSSINLETTLINSGCTDNLEPQAEDKAVTMP